MIANRIRWLAPALVGIVVVHSAPGQGITSVGIESSVTAHGSAELRRLPTVLRTLVEFSSKGKDASEAIDRLNERRETIKKRLATIGAENIVFGEPGRAEKTQQQRHFEMAMGQRFRNKGAAKAKVAIPTELVMTVHFDAPIKADSVEDLYRKSEKLQAKIRDLDLGGLKDPVTLTPQEEEMNEEMQAMQAQMGGEEGVKRGEPMFVHIAKIAPADRDKALADAFKDARGKADQLARAAGVEVGELIQLHNANYGDADYPGYRGMPYENPNMATMMQQIGADEVGAPSAGYATKRFQVVAGYRLKNKGDAK